MNAFTLPALAGIAGGVVIAAVGMAYRAAIGKGFWSLPNGIGGIALGAEQGATLGFGVPTVTGVALHMIFVGDLRHRYGLAFAEAWFGPCPDRYFGRHRRLAFQLLCCRPRSRRIKTSR